MIRLAAALAASLWVLGCTDEPVPVAGVPRTATVGATVPTLHGLNPAGDSVSLSFPAPGPVVVQLGAFGCGLCRDQWELLDSLAGSPGWESVQVIVATMDERSSDKRIANWVRENHPSFALWRDEGAVRATLGIEALPQVVVIGSDGVVLRRQFGFPKDFVPEWVADVTGALGVPH